MKKSSILGLGIVALVACGATEAQFRGAQYTHSLEECNRTAKGLCASIECENYYRRREVREERKVPSFCLDGGTPDAAPATP